MYYYVCFSYFNNVIVLLVIIFAYSRYLCRAIPLDTCVWSFQENFNSVHNKLVLCNSGHVLVLILISWLFVSKMSRGFTL